MSSPISPAWVRLNEQSWSALHPRSDIVVARLDFGLWASKRHPVAWVIHLISGLERQAERAILTRRDQGAPCPRKGNLPPEQRC